MYNKIYEFCKARNLGNIYKNCSENLTPRINFLLNLLDNESIPYEIDKFEIRKTFGFNIILRGTSNKMVVAHHDIINPDIDNANDNSASVINAIMLKKLRPDLNVVLLDGEECGGLGSSRLAETINSGEFGDIIWVLNLELSGRGGKYFFIGDYPGNLTNHIKSIFDCPIVTAPFNDSVILKRMGIDSVVINPLPPVNEGRINENFPKWNGDTYLDFSLLYNCHSERDTIDTISTSDMKEFVEEVLLKIVD